MSAVNYLVRPDWVVIASDTLSIDFTTRKVRAFVSKCFPLPHLDAALMVTGDARFALDAFTAIQFEVYASSAPDLASVLRPLLAKLWRRREAPLGTATAYLFGFDPVAGRFFGWVFRSTSDFALERYDTHSRMKPEIPLEDLPTFKGVEDFATVVAVQKQLDESAPAEDRIGIGGDVILTELTPRAISIRRIHRFPDFAETWARIVAFHEGNATREAAGREVSP
jgi:hypothetical protein